MKNIPKPKAKSSPPSSKRRGAISVPMEFEDLVEGLLKLPKVQKDELEEIEKVAGKRRKKFKRVK